MNTEQKRFKKTMKKRERVEKYKRKVLQYPVMKRAVQRRQDDMGRKILEAHNKATELDALKMTTATDLPKKEKTL